MNNIDNSNERMGKGREFLDFRLELKFLEFRFDYNSVNIEQIDDKREGKSKLLNVKLTSPLKNKKKGYFT